MTTNVEYEYKLEYFPKYDPDYGWNDATFEWVSLEVVEDALKENLRDDKMYSEEGHYKYRVVRRPIKGKEIFKVKKGAICWK